MDKKQIFLPTFLVGLLSAWLVFAFLPVRRETVALKERLRELEDRERKEIPEAQVDLMEAVVDSLALKYDISMDRIYPEKKLLDLGPDVEAVGKKYGLRLISIAPDYESLSSFAESQGEISELPVRIHFQGSFRGFAGFLDKLPQFPFAMRVHQAVLHKEEEDGSAINIQLQGVVILRKERVRDDVLNQKKVMNQA